MVSDEYPQFRKAVTLADVAALADVSAQTVSRVVNNDPKVSGRTRARVSAAIAELNYLPNRLATGLARQRTYSVGFATNDLAFHAPSQLTSAIERAARAAGYSLMVCMITAPDLAAITHAVRTLRERQVDGVLLNASLDEAGAAELQRRFPDFPCVFMDVPLTAPVPSALLDQYHGAELAAEHLIALGHRQFACVKGPSQDIVENARQRAWQDVLAQHGLTFTQEVQGDWTPSSGYSATVSLLAGAVPFTALLCANDQMAAGALRALWERGLHVPQDVSVIGYDDTPESAHLIPPLTTVRQDFAVLGQRAFQLLREMLSGEVRESVVSQPELVKRASTAPPAGPERLHLQEALKVLQHYLAWNEPSNGG